MIPWMAVASTKRRRQPRLPIEVRREQVLDAALRLISAHGYSAATMEAIAREAEVAKPVVYNAYPGLGPLLKALFAREEQRGLQDVVAGLSELDPGADLDATLVAGVTRFLESVREHPVTWQLILLPADGTPSEVREHVEAGRAFALRGIRTLVEAGLAQRPGFQRLDIELLSRSMLAICEQAATLVLAQPDEFPPERYADFVREVLRLLPGGRAQKTA
jgi:AcrR family transcriptional regulator